LKLEKFVVFKEVLSEIMPNLVIQAAGMSTGEDCEIIFNLSVFINGGLRFGIARAVHDLKIPFVYISIGHLFSGKKY